MKNDHLPSFSMLDCPDTAEEFETDDSACANHVTFTTDGFANFPHFDKTDKSYYALMFTLPTFKNGKLAPKSYDNTGIFFPFPDYGFYLDFTGHTFGIIIWGAKKYCHFTIKSIEGSGEFYRSSGSLQLNSKTAKAFVTYYSPGYADRSDKKIISDYTHILNRADSYANSKRK